MIGPAPLALGAGVSAAIAEHARQTYPNECCGALIGRAEMVTEAFALPNTTEEGPRRRFLVRAEDCTLAENRAKAQGAEVLGFYHSHPDAPARPSQYDLDHAWPTWWYVIVAVEAGEPVASTCWRLALDRSKFEQQRLLGDPLATRPGYVEDRESSVR